MAKIHSVEWTPAILPNETLEVGLNSNWYGLLTYKWRKGKARKTLAEVNIRNPELGGIVGNPINRHDCRIRTDRGIRRGLSPAFAAAGDSAVAAPRQI